MSNRKKSKRERTKQLTRAEQPKNIKAYIRAVEQVQREARDDRSD